MTFKEIVDAVLSDRFSESQRSDAKTWVNHRYWWLWSLEPWTFKNATDDITATAGAQAASSLPADFLIAHGIVTDDGDALRAIPDTRAFLELYHPSSSETGEPEAYTVIGNQILLGPTPTETATFKLLYEREFTELSADGDVPALPVGSHFALVHGGAAEGLKLQNDPSWQSFEQDFQATLTVLRQGYLSSVRGAWTQFGAYRPDQWA